MNVLGWNRVRVFPLALAMAALFAAGVLSGGPSAAASTRTADCASLAGTELLDVGGWPAQVTDGTPVAGTASGLALCDVRGAITVTARHSTSIIHFQVLVPNQWNDRYVQVGGGGFCGSVPTESGSGGPYLTDGYAVASDDGGHQGSSLDGSFGYNNYAAELTWGRLSEHLTSLAAKDVLKDLQGAGPLYSYFIGCSTGGRQALVEAQQFPADFNGIVAGAPANRQNELAPLSQGVRELQNRDPNRNIVVDNATAQVVQQAVLQQCDALDGIKDGIIRDPRACHLSLASLQCPASGGTNCLTSAQMAVLDNWYHSPRSAAGVELYPGGLPVGSEGGWPGLDIGTNSTFSGSGTFAEQVLRYLAFPKDPGPAFSLYDFNPSRDAGNLHALDHLYNADSTNLTAFEHRGGKLITWQGFADPLISPFGLIQYYEDVVQANGNSLAQTEEWYRTFFLPGVYHCAGGPGPDQVDWLSSIRQWVENGQAPQQVIATKTDSSGAVTLRRPVYPYPLEAVYNGTGSTNDPANFHPTPGPRGRKVFVS